MAASVIVSGQRLLGYGRLGQMKDFMAPAAEGDWLPEAKHRAACLARWMSEQDMAARPPVRSDPNRFGPAPP
ncbi:hypothetical protein [Prosthecomicrobium hirschii]|uniref:hypothetical protein n=1 Tax=Prosthecodimorpha hirschii TaxID=665126 RepID=UPI00221EC5CC|nr:hypothetical protein [Prosthecomicrobium hirschii]MCW1839462.1 hypothetical protein [Prosthecomicrobium hirschii]